MARWHSQARWSLLKLPPSSACCQQLLTARRQPPTPPLQLQQPCTETQSQQQKTQPSRPQHSSGLGPQSASAAVAVPNPQRTAATEWLQLQAMLGQQVRHDPSGHGGVKTLWVHFAPTRPTRPGISPCKSSYRQQRSSLELGTDHCLGSLLPCQPICLENIPPFLAANMQFYHSPCWRACPRVSLEL